MPPWPGGIRSRLALWVFATGLRFAHFAWLSSSAQINQDHWKVAAALGFIIAIHIWDSLTPICFFHEWAHFVRCSSDFFTLVAWIVDTYTSIASNFSSGRKRDNGGLHFACWIRRTEVLLLFLDTPANHFAGSGCVPPLQPEPSALPTANPTLPPSSSFRGLGPFTLQAIP